MLYTHGSISIIIASIHFITFSGVQRNLRHDDRLSPSVG